MLRSVLHLSGRLLRPLNPRFPGLLSPPLSTHPRFLSSSSSPSPGAARWATYDYDPLIDRLCASASDTPVECDAWVIYDPVSGRIVMQEPPLSSSPTTEEDGEGAGEREGEENAGVKEKEKGKWNGKGKRNRKGRLSASGEEGQTSRSPVAAARKSAGNGGKESVSFVCSYCGEVDSQWWGNCRHCKAMGTLQRCRDMVLQSLQEANIANTEHEEEVEGAGEREGEDNAGLKEKEKGQWKRKKKGRASATGEEGQTSRSSVAAERKSAGKGGKARIPYVCTHCGKVHPRWWGYCHHCRAPGTIQKSREMVLQSLQEVNITIQRRPLSSSSTAEKEEGEGADQREDEENDGVKEKEGQKGSGKWKRKMKKKGQASASGNEGQSSQSSAGMGGKARVSYVCSHCGEGDSQWWQFCRHCKVMGPLRRAG